VPDVDILVAGGGIAGLTAGLTAARLGRSTLVLTGGPPGGLLISIDAIEGFPGFPDGVPGYELCPVTMEQAEAAGAAFGMAEVTGIEPESDGWRVTADDGQFLARTLIVATGARMRELGVPGEERLRGRGVSHCASCDAPLLRDRIVGVVGGGDSALQESLTLAESVDRVVLLVRGDELAAQETFRQRVLAHPKIEVRYGVVVEEILGDQTVTGVRTSDGELELGAVFAYVGLEPASDLVPAGVRLEDGRVVTDAKLRTELPGLLAAGIVRHGAAGRAVASAGDGATAAVAAHRYLDDGVWPEPGFAEAIALGQGGGSGG
jgi:thioredoxin reductase (NADPH)